MNNILLDTNLLIYAIDEDSKYYNSVHKLFDDESNNLFTTSKNISEFLSVITRYPEKSISIKDALIVIEELKSIYTDEEIHGKPWWVWSAEMVKNQQVHTARCLDFRNGKVIGYQCDWSNQRHRVIAVRGNL